MVENKKKDQMNIIYPETLISTDEIEIYGEEKGKSLTETNPFGMAKRQIDLVAKKMNLNKILRNSLKE